MPRVNVRNAGNCYRETATMIIEAMPDDAMLVHGYPRLTGGKHRGRKFGHAWVEREVDGIMWCYDHQRDEPIIAVLYYAIGQIDASETKRYTRRQAIRNTLRTKRYGPWGKQPKDALFAG